MFSRRRTKVAAAEPHFSRRIKWENGGIDPTLHHRHDSRIGGQRQRPPCPMEVIAQSSIQGIEDGVIINRFISISLSCGSGIQVRGDPALLTILFGLYMETVWYRYTSSLPCTF